MKLNRMAVAWIACLVVILIPICLSPHCLQADQPVVLNKPNILWLTCEDIGPHLGCYEYETVKTPSLDALASRSLTYELAWSNYPVCAPARTTIITGIYATSLGAGNMRCNAIKPDAVELLPTLMRQAGYYCTNASKTDYNLLKAGSPWDDSRGKAHWKNRPVGKPFFAVFNNTKTHESQIRKRPHQQQIEPASVKLFPYWPDTPEVRTDWAQYLDNIQTVDRWVAKHLNAIEQAGLAEDTIVIFYGDHGSGMPRHKRFAGDSGMRVPMIVHVPEKWKSLWPSDYQPGAKTRTPFGFVDLAPSMLDAVGEEVPARMQGRSIFSKEDDRKKYVYGFRNRMDERYDVSRSICDGRFVYIRNYMPNLPHGQFVDYQQQTDATAIWKKMFDQGELNALQAAFWKPRSFEELYDLQSDPHETNNLAGTPDHKSKQQELADALDQKIKSVVDLDLVPESELYQFELTTGRPRNQYPGETGLSFERLLEVAGGTDVKIQDLKDPQASVRFWALQRLLDSPQKVRQSQIEQVKEMFNDRSSSVQIKAAEVAISCEQHLADSIELLIRSSDFNNSDYYAAVNALDCLDRYSHHLTSQHLQLIRAVPVKCDAVKRGGKNLTKIMKRFAAEIDDVK